MGRETKRGAKEEMKEWNGNSKTTFAQLGASNHSEKEREKNDFYATDPKTLEIFLDKLNEDEIYLHKNIWECACGQGHLSEVLKSKGYDVFSTDIINRGYNDKTLDFLSQENANFSCDILTNPPYKFAQEFVEKALEIQAEGYYTIMFLKIQFLEGQARQKLFKKYPLKYVYVNSVRQNCYINGNIDKKLNGAMCYCWFIWEKGFKGETTVRWI